MTTLAHLAAACHACGSKTHPCVDMPLKLVAHAVDRPPNIDTVELLLCNWEYTGQLQGFGDDSSDDEQRSPQHRSPQYQCVWRFLGSPDEEWFRSVHIFLHRDARDVVKAIRMGHVAMNEHNDLGATSCMATLSRWLNKVCDYFDKHFDSKDSRTEPITMRRLQPFICWGIHKDLTWEETACWVYLCGSSVLIPALHAIMGISFLAFEQTDTVEGDRLLHDMQRSLEELKECMPKAHREFLACLELPENSLRHYCYRRFGSEDVPVEALHDLETSYNDTLNALVRFLSRRVHLVARFCPSVASSFGTLHTKVEESMRVSRLQLLMMRQRVDQRLDHRMDK